MTPEEVGALKQASDDARNKWLFAKGELENEVYAKFLSGYNCLEQDTDFDAEDAITVSIETVGSGGAAHSLVMVEIAVDAPELLRCSSYIRIETFQGVLSAVCTVSTNTPWSTLNRHAKIGPKDLMDMWVDALREYQRRLELAAHKVKEHFGIDVIWLTFPKQR